MTESKCDHGVVFDRAEAEKILSGWTPIDFADWVMGNPGAERVRRRFPRLHGTCPKGCGLSGIFYASMDDYIMGDW